MTCIQSTSGNINLAAVPGVFLDSLRTLCLCADTRGFLSLVHKRRSCTKAATLRPRFDLMVDE